MSRQLRVARARYRGDPGLGGFLKKVGKGLVGGAVGLVTGGPAGAVAGAAMAVRGGTATPSRNVATAGLVGGPMPGGPQEGFRIPFPGPSDLRVRPGAILPGGDPFVMREGGTMVQAGMKLACPSGYRPNKTSYFLKDGTFIPAGSKCVKARRRNPLNPRALDRALGRLNSAKRFQAKLKDYSTDKYTASGGAKKC